jgi:hypothetical protein
LDRAAGFIAAESRHLNADRKPLLPALRSYDGHEISA